MTFSHDAKQQFEILGFVAFPVVYVHHMAGTLCYQGSVVEVIIDSM